MKNKLIALLKTLFSDKGFNAKELESLADIVIGQHTLTDDSTDEDLQTAATASKPTADFVQSVASRQVTDAKKPKPVEKPITPEAKPDVDPNETVTEKMLRQALEGITALTAEIATIKGDKVANTRREQIAKLLENSNDDYKADKLADFDLLSFKDDESFETYKTALGERAKAFVKPEGSENGVGDVFKPTGGTGGKTAGKGVKEASAAEVDAAVNSII